MPYAAVNDIRMFYEEQGQGAPRVRRDAGGLPRRASAARLLAGAGQPEPSTPGRGTELQRGGPGSYPGPTLLIAGETDPWGNLDQMLAMRRAIPHSEMLILNHAGMDELSNHACQYTRADIVGPIVLDFLARHGDGAQISPVA
jgi:pimeloyl-ACP methyl ester carboxylesterase